MAAWSSVVFSSANILRDTVFALVLAVCVSVVIREGAGGLARKLLLVLRQLPGVNWVIGWVLRREVRGFLRQLDPDSFKEGPRKGLALPEKGNCKCWECSNLCMDQYYCTKLH